MEEAGPPKIPCSLFGFVRNLVAGNDAALSLAPQNEEEAVSGVTGGVFSKPADKPADKDKSYWFLLQVVLCCAVMRVRTR